jgi:hypothetical protein
MNVLRVAAIIATIVIVGFDHAVLDCGIGWCLASDAQHL